MTKNVTSVAFLAEQLEGWRSLITDSVLAPEATKDDTAGVALMACEWAETVLRFADACERHATELRERLHDTVRVAFGVLTAVPPQMQPVEAEMSALAELISMRRTSTWPYAEPKS